MTRLIKPLFLAVMIIIGFTASTQDRAKYIFLFIGDGMGQAQVNAAQVYQAELLDEDGFYPFTFTQFPFTGFVSTHSHDKIISASASAGTALSTGFKTRTGRVAMDAGGYMPLTTLSEKAKAKGMKAGIISSVSLDHATPATFYAHQYHRRFYFEIGYDLVTSDIDFFGGGGLKIPAGKYNQEFVNLYKKAIDEGFTVTVTTDEFHALDQGSLPVIAMAPGLTKDATLPYAIDMRPGDLTLADFTAKGIELLDNDKGFFIMIEGGKIDWACHDNDAATTIREVIAFDEAVAVARKFYDKHPEETLIVVTADHETGGMALGNYINQYELPINVLQYQKVSSDHFKEMVDLFHDELSGVEEDDFNAMMDLIKENFGLGKRNQIPLSKEEKDELRSAFQQCMYAATEEGAAAARNDKLLVATIIYLVSSKAGIGWTTGAHTGINVPVYAIGVGAGQFNRYIDNTDIPSFIEAVMPSGPSPDPQ